MTPEQQKALALASARQRQAESQGRAQGEEGFDSLSLNNVKDVEISDVEDMARSAASGLVRGTPKGLDFIGQAGAYGVNKAIGGDKSFSDFDHGTLNKVATAIFGEEYQPETMGGDMVKFVSEMFSPSSIAKIAKTAVGAGKGLTGSLDNYLKHPEELKEAYVRWRNGLNDIPVSSSEIKQELIKPSLLEIGDDAEFATRDALEKLGQFKNLGNKKRSLGSVESYRKSLKQINNSPEIAQPIRNQTDEFIGSRAGVGGRDAYRRFKTYDKVEGALKNSSNQTEKAVRGKINNLSEAGMNSAELLAKRKAGNPSAVGNMLTGAGNKLNSLTASAVGLGTGSVSLAAGTMAAGSALKAGGKYLGNRNINNLKQVLINGREVPNAGEKGGALLRKILQNNGVNVPTGTSPKQLETLIKVLERGKHPVSGAAVLDRMNER